MKDCMEMPINHETSNFKMYLDTLSILSENSDDYFYLWDLKSGRVWHFGNIGEKYNLMEPGEEYCMADRWSSIVYQRDRNELEKDLKMLERGEMDRHNMDYRLLDKKGKTVWVNCRGTVQKDKDGTPILLIGRVSEINLRYKVDAMTGLFNASKMQDDIETIFSEMGTGFLMILGVDNLKNINIKNGREQGNQILRHVARALEDVIDDAQRIYRLDGDNFAVCIQGTESEAILDTYKQIQDAVHTECTLSAGVVAFHNSTRRDIGSLYQYAEEALDKAKKGGKNRLEFFLEEDYRKKIAEIELIEELQHSIENDCEGFSLVYQSQVKSSSHELYGAEALLRYDSPTRGRVMPDEFIPLLERTYMVCRVGLWVLQTALEQCREWRKQYPDFHMSVNISYVQLMQPDIMNQVLGILAGSGVPGDALTLEVTESMHLRDPKYFNYIFSEWGNAGIGIAVDDFGTGYSNFAYLKNLNINEIKIDRCFVRDIQKSSYNYRLLHSIFELAMESQIHICCEGVEESEELQVLEELKPDLLQGYFFSKPCEREQFESMYFI